jgi:hypothetical protein
MRCIPRYIPRLRDSHSQKVTAVLFATSSAFFGAVVLIILSHLSSSLQVPHDYRLIQWIIVPLSYELQFRTTSTIASSTKKPSPLYDPGTSYRLIGQAIIPKFKIGPVHESIRHKASQHQPQKPKKTQIHHPPPLCTKFPHANNHYPPPTHFHRLDAIHRINHPEHPPLYQIMNDQPQDNELLMDATAGATLAVTQTPQSTTQNSVNTDQPMEISNTANPNTPTAVDDEGFPDCDPHSDGEETQAAIQLFTHTRTHRNETDPMDVSAHSSTATPKAQASRGNTGKKAPPTGNPLRKSAPPPMATKTPKKTAPTSATPNDPNDHFVYNPASAHHARIDTVIPIPFNTTPIPTMATKLRLLFKAFKAADKKVVLYQYSVESEARPALTKLKDIAAVGKMLYRYADTGTYSYPRKALNCRVSLHIGSEYPIPELLEKMDQHLPDGFQLWPRGLKAERISRAGYFVFSTASQLTPALERDITSAILTPVSLKFRRAAKNIDLFEDTYATKDGITPDLPMAICIDCSTTDLDVVRRALRLLFPIIRKPDRSAYPRGLQYIFVYSFNPGETPTEATKQAVGRFWILQGKVNKAEITQSITGLFRTPTDLSNAIVTDTKRYISPRQALLNLRCEYVNGDPSKYLFTSVEYTTHPQTGQSNLKVTFRPLHKDYAKNVIQYLSRHFEVIYQFPPVYTTHVFTNSHLLATTGIDYCKDTGFCFDPELVQDGLPDALCTEFAAEFEFDLSLITSNKPKATNKQNTDNLSALVSVDTMGTKRKRVTKSIKGTPDTSIKGKKPPGKAKQPETDEDEDEDDNEDEEEDEDEDEDEEDNNDIEEATINDEESHDTELQKVHDKIKRLKDASKITTTNHIIPAPAKGSILAEMTRLADRWDTNPNNHEEHMARLRALLTMAGAESQAPGHAP